MALAPGETNESFIREVDENLRRSQAEQFAKRWGKWLIGLAVLFLVAVGAFLFWRNQQTQKAAENSEKFSAVLADVGAQKTDQAAGQLDAIASDANDSMAAAARLTRAALAIQQGDRATAIAQYKLIADDGGVPQDYRDAALVRQTQLEFDQIRPEEVISRLQPLATKDSAWFGTAGEYTAIAMIKQNRRQEAAQLLTAIAAERSVPEPIRSRVQQLSSGLALPATSAAPPAAKTAPQG